MYPVPKQPFFTYAPSKAGRHRVRPLLSRHVDQGRDVAREHVGQRARHACASQRRLLRGQHQPRQLARQAARRTARPVEPRLGFQGFKAPERPAWPAPAVPASAAGSSPRCAAKGKVSWLEFLQGLGPRRSLHSKHQSRQLPRQAARCIAARSQHGQGSGLLESC